MSDAQLPISNMCSQVLEAILIDPLDPSAEVEAHMQICRACSEARVAYLAQEDCPAVLAPARYFERLSGRILRKLPAPSLQVHTRRFYWAAAAAILFAVGATAFSVGRANQIPLVEANLPRTTTEIQEILPDTPFQDNEDAVTQLTDLSQEDADAVFQSLSNRPAHPLVGK
jgi:hypothetical protein